MSLSGTPDGDGHPRVTYWSIQYLRGLAAVGVVIFHVYDNSTLPLGATFEIGAHGVDVFFVISGFIMYSAARGERLYDFISRRLIRIFPLYWAATFLAIALYFLFDRVHPSGTETVLSLSLIPHYSEAHPDQVWPILVPGWTLSFEILFYALFAVGLAIRRVVVVPAAAIGALVVAGVIFEPRSAPLTVATNPLLIEFMLGVAIALALDRRPALLLPLALSAATVALAEYVREATGATLYAGAATIVAGSLWLERTQTRGPIRALQILGDASYSIYLFHTPLLFVIERLLVVRLEVDSSPLANVIAVAAIAVVVAIGVAAHFMLEKPLLRKLNDWNRRLTRRSAAISS